MTEQRQKLIDEFNKWFDTNPNKGIMAAQCANIAEKYAAEQLKLYDISNLLKAERESTKEEIREWLRGEDFEGLAERL